MAMQMFGVPGNVKAYTASKKDFAKNVRLIPPVKYRLNAGDLNSKNQSEEAPVKKSFFSSAPS
jgi:hypothetical protein